MANYYPPVKGGKVIGNPYQGTHGRAFNKKGGSDNWESENAVDIQVPVGTPVYAVEDGTIGTQYGSLGKTGRFAGMRLHLKAKNGEFYYAHLSAYAAGITPGTKVHAGQLLGYSGEANGVAHLHFASTTNISPKLVIKGLSADPEPTVALPGINESKDGYANLNDDGTVKQVPDYVNKQQEADIANVSQIGGLPQAQAPLSGSFPADTTLTPVQSGTNTWQLIAQQGDVSPDTLRLAQLASLSNASG